MWSGDLGFQEGFKWSFGTLKPEGDFLNFDDYSKCKEILAKATKIKEYADKAKERETESKKLAEAVDYDKLVKWLIDNKGKVAAYDYTNFISKESISSTSSLGIVTLIPIDKSYTTSIDGVEKTFHLKGNLSIKKGNVDLSANDKVYSSISILPNQDKIQYTLNYNYENSDERAIRLETNNTEEMEYLFIAQGFSYTEPYKKTVTDKFISELKLAGADCDKIDYLYENIPSFVTPVITDEQKWTSLKSLLNCRVDKVGTDEGKAINNLIKGVSTAYLEDKINTETATLMAVYAKLKMVDKLPFATAITKKISETWTGNEELSTVYPQETKIPGNENGQYKISCFGITNNDLTFGYTYFYFCRGLYSDTPCNGDAPGNKLFRFEDHCVDLFTLSGTAPVILQINGEKIILPAFIAGQIMQTAKADKIDEIRSFYAGLLLPELIVKPSTLSGWSKFLKGEGVVNGVKNVWDDIILNGNKGVVEALSLKYKNVDEFLVSTEYTSKVSTDFVKYQARGGALDLAKYTTKHRVITGNRMRGKIAESVFLDLEKGLKPDFGVQTSDGVRYIDNLLNGTARELKSGKITNTAEFQRQVKKDIEILVSDDELVRKIEWHALDGIDDSALKFIREQMTSKGVNPLRFKIVIY
ncbi:hypothetical protein [Pedobacter sp. R20-19]|uniref:hypothetical protein n=1 Tax=Pedobacter sp. R20-19 TaxID=1270196 RepID=UPI000493584C|nr:hypothetical protein [Pedobacter sp. R20-19]